MKHYIIGGAILFAIAGAFSAWPAKAQVACASPKVMLEALASNYAERPSAWGTLAGGRIMIITLSEQGSFSILVGSPTSLCMVAAGTNWTVQKEERT